METETMYVFVDKSGKCLDTFVTVPDDTDYHRVVANRLHSKDPLSVGDMLAFRDVLQEAGFVWGIDFYTRKVQIEDNGEQVRTKA